MVALRTAVILLGFSLHALARDQCIVEPGGTVGTCCTFRGRHGRPMQCQRCADAKVCITQRNGCTKNGVTENIWNLMAACS
ncbi:hypothetical protein HRS9139_02624 [Pyrenophora teres f. teres]|uniref:Uncharacterized protein n=1 Tax=Pyrenophora teres f. teres TaxID=97479 RepID=A0A6S6VCF8_9PLEO|nr:hypothetical protein HRS9139_02624 [Pyrenophora teres f. teres]KAE8871028.1 hypothetical protein PTNB29_01372 [Pyrenophora teres f. teres]CAE7016258.1 hypothetical protein PTTW11_02928 [Pyrenophora teres f. teres]